MEYNMKAVQILMEEKKGFWKHIEVTSKTQLMDFRGFKYFFSDGVTTWQFIL